MFRAVPAFGFDFRIALPSQLGPVVCVGRAWRFFMCLRRTQRKCRRVVAPPPSKGRPVAYHAGVRGSTGDVRKRANAGGITAPELGSSSLLKASAHTCAFPGTWDQTRVNGQAPSTMTRATSLATKLIEAVGERSFISAPRAACESDFTWRLHLSFIQKVDHDLIAIRIARAYHTAWPLQEPSSNLKNLQSSSVHPPWQKAHAQPNSANRAP